MQPRWVDSPCLVVRVPIASSRFAFYGVPRALASFQPRERMPVPQQSFYPNQGHQGTLPCEAGAMLTASRTTAIP